VISQIDNMVAGILAENEALEAEVKRLREALDHSIDGLNDVAIAFKKFNAKGFDATIAEINKHVAEVYGIGVGKPTPLKTQLDAPDNKSGEVGSEPYAKTTA